MNQVAIKRNKITQKIQQEQKEMYFRKAREQAINHINGEHQNQESTQNAKHLRDIIRRSIQPDLLLPQIRCNYLLQNIQEMLRTTNQGRQIQLALVLMSNLLLDNITLDQKEKLVSMCLQSQSNSFLKAFEFNKNQTNIACLNSTSNNILVLSQTLSFIQQSLLQKCQSLIFQKLVFYSQQIFKCIQIQQQITSEVQIILSSVVSNIVSTLQKLLFVKPEYKEQVLGRFQFFNFKFRSLLFLHSDLKPYLNSHLAIRFHQGLLLVQAILSTIIDIQKYPVYFLSCQLMSIIMKQLKEQTSQNCLQHSLNIITNIICSYSQYQPQFTATLVHQFNNHLDQFNSHIFFKRILSKDRFSWKKMILFQCFFSITQLYPFVQSFVDHYWETIIDHCCELLSSETTHWDQSQTILKIIVQLSLRMQNSKNHLFFNYLQNTKGYSVIESAKEQMQIHRQACPKQYSQFQQLQSLCFYLLDLIDQQSR